MHFPWLGIFFWVGLFTWLSIVAWSRYLKEQERQQTLRAFAASGKAIDAETLDKLLPKQTSKQSAPTALSVARGLMIGGIVMTFVGIGILIGAQFIANIDPFALWGMSTGGVIVCSLALGLITAGVVTRRNALRDEEILRSRADGDR